MRSRLLVVLWLLSLGCDDDTRGLDAGVGLDAALPGPFVDMELALRCDRTGGCVPQPVTLCGVHQSTTCLLAVPPPSVQCRVDELGSQLVLQARQGGPTIELVRAAGECSVTVVTTDGTIFRGACSEQPPAPPELPCQLANVTPRLAATGALTLEGEVFCQGMRALVGSEGVELEITGQGLGTTAVESPGRFVVANCDALVPEPR